MRLNLYLKGKSREFFAKQIGSTKNYVNLLACNSRRPSPDLALKIEKATDGQVTVMELLFPETKPTNKILRSTNGRTIPS